MRAVAAAVRCPFCGAEEQEVALPAGTGSFRLRCDSCRITLGLFRSITTHIL